MRARPWWAAFGVAAVVWLILAGLRVSTYSESSDVPGFLEPAIYVLGVVGIALLLVAIAASVRARAGRAGR